MSDDERLREAGDPTTSSDRLDEIRRWIARESVRRSPAELFEVYAVQNAVMRNPSLPLDVLRQALRGRSGYGSIQAWHNPMVPLLLLQEPLEEYTAAALRTLRSLSPVTIHAAIAQATDLGEAVALCARTPADVAGAVHGHARHLASLFGLPWEPSAG